MEGKEKKGRVEEGKGKSPERGKGMEEKAGEGDTEKEKWERDG